MVTKRILKHNYSSAAWPCGRLQPVLVIDVAAAVIAAVRDQGFSMGKTFELGGPDVFTINELVHLYPNEIKRLTLCSFNIAVPFGKCDFNPYTRLRFCFMLNFWKPYHSNGVRFWWCRFIWCLRQSESTLVYYIFPFPLPRWTHSQLLTHLLSTPSA